ncbi:hypothetical protein HRH25_08260 [Flavisolibacter sp. BT320]|nr:hypothetical protein [Flavisolibacter longurius]
MTGFIITAIAAGIASIYGVRYLLARQRKQKRQLNLTGAYKRLLARKGLSVSHAETIGNRRIALDNKSGKLVFLDHSCRVHKSHVIPLRSITATRVKKEKNKDGHIERVVLEVESAKRKTDSTLCFFDHAHDALSELTLLAKKAQHWKNRIDGFNYSYNVGPEAEYVI